MSNETPQGPPKISVGPEDLLGDDSAAEAPGQAPPPPAAPTPAPPAAPPPAAGGYKPSISPEDLAGGGDADPETAAEEDGVAAARKGGARQPVLVYEVYKPPSRVKPVILALILIGALGFGGYKYYDSMPRKGVVISGIELTPELGERIMATGWIGGAEEVQYFAHNGRIKNEFFFFTKQGVGLVRTGKGGSKWIPFDDIRGVELTPGTGEPPRAKVTLDLRDGPAETFNIPGSDGDDERFFGSLKRALDFSFIKSLN